MQIADGLHAFLWQDATANNCNCFLIEGSKTILIDPGHRRFFDRVSQHLEGLQLSPDHVDAVVVTHGHPDHIEAAAAFGASTLVGWSRREHEFLSKEAGPAARALGLEGFEPSFFLDNGDLSIGNVNLQVLLTPGHSPGSVCLYWPEKKALFTGDLVFRNGLGRTDLPGGDGNLLKESIRRIAALDVEILLPGHGEMVRGKAAVRENFQQIERYWFRFV